MMGLPPSRRFWTASVFWVRKAVCKRTLEAIVEAVAEGMTHQPAKGDVAALTHLLLRQRRLLEALGLDGPAET